MAEPAGGSGHPHGLHHRHRDAGSSTQPSASLLMPEEPLEEATPLVPRPSRSSSVHAAHSGRAPPGSRGGLQPLVRARSLLLGLHGRSLHLPAGAGWPRPISRHGQRPLHPLRALLVVPRRSLLGARRLLRHVDPPALRQVNAVSTWPGACSKSATTSTRCSTTTSGSSAVIPMASRWSWRSTIPTVAWWPSSSTPPTASPTRTCGPGYGTSTCPPSCPAPMPIWSPPSPHCARGRCPAEDRLSREAGPGPHRLAVVPQHPTRGGVGPGHRRAPAPARSGGQGPAAVALP